jgi:diguanylate cyclase (GGDEF)-like protein
MPHGLLMFGPDGKLEVANRKSHQLLGVEDAERLENRNFKTLLRYSVAKGIIARSDAPKLQRLLRNIENGTATRKAQIRMASGSVLEFSLKRRHGGGGVLIFEDVTERIRAEHKIQHMARYDALTGLSNRAEMAMIVGNMFGMQEEDKIAAAFMLDVNDFKHINDTYGHPAGDAILQQIAARLREIESRHVRASRLGGDEFFIAATGLAAEGGAQAFANALSDRLCGSYDCNGSVFQVSVSMGVVAPAQVHENLDSLLVKADLALYSVKAAPGSRWQVYEEAMSFSYRRRQRMKNALREAVRAQALHVIYQPILDSTSMRLKSCEALSRWNHQEFGQVPPSEFIPLAEEMGLISEISRFMLKRACADCMTWNPNIGVSVNLSAYDFEHADVPAMVSEALHLSGLAPHRLEIEVTESIVLGNKSNARATLNELKRMGISIALDDFGTGYSNLSYLHDLPLDRIKIDRSFVTGVIENARALQLLRGVISLAREVGLFITLEGIENVEQMELIEPANCVDRLQGFLFGASYTASLVRDLGEHVWGTGSRSWVHAPVYRTA